MAKQTFNPIWKVALCIPDSYRTQPDRDKQFALGLLQQFLREQRTLPCHRYISVSKRME